MSNAIKDASLVFSGQTISFAIRFITSILIARWLGAEGKGLYASLIMIPNIMITIGELGMRQSIVYYLGRKIFTIDDIVNTAILMVAILSIPLIICCLYIYNTSYSGTFSAISQILAVLIIPFTFLTKMLSGVFLGLNKVGVYSKVTWVPAFIELILTIFLVYYLHLSLVGSIISLLLGSLFTVFYGLHISLKLVSLDICHFSFKVAKSLLSKGILFALALFIIQLNYRIDIYLLKDMVSMNDIGIYSVGVSLAEIFWQIPSAVAVVILARTATSNNDNQKYKVAQSLRVSLLVMILVSMAAILIFNYLIPIIYGVAYVRSVNVNRILMIGVVIFTFYKILNSRIAGQGKPQIALVLFVPCLILKIIFNLLWVPQYGIEGAAWASNISYILASILILIAFCKFENISVVKVLKPQKNDLDFIRKIIKLKRNGNNR